MNGFGLGGGLFGLMALGVVGATLLTCANGCGYQTRNREEMNSHKAEMNHRAYEQGRADQASMQGSYNNGRRIQRQHSSFDWFYDW